jgi:hypothetical protein
MLENPKNLGIEIWKLELELKAIGMLKDQNVTNQI